MYKVNIKKKSLTIDGTISLIFDSIPKSKPEIKIIYFVKFSNISFYVVQVVSLRETFATSNTTNF